MVFIGRLRNYFSDSPSTARFFANPQEVLPGDTAPPRFAVCLAVGLWWANRLRFSEI
jgi:hypothetical protein